MQRSTIDRLISTTAMIVVLVLLAGGAAAIFGGNFGLQNVRQRLEPQNIAFPDASEMTPEESAEVGEFAGQSVDTGPEAEAFSRYIGVHLAAINDGRTYSETSAAAGAEGLDPETRAQLRQKADTLFRGETLRAILLNAYGWWMVSQIVLYSGYAMVAAGIVLAVFAALGFRHAKKVDPALAQTTLRTAA